MAASHPGVMLLFYVLFNEEFFPSFTTFDVFNTALVALVARLRSGEWCGRYNAHVYTVTFHNFLSIVCVYWA
jgi:hypothetical protein